MKWINRLALTILVSSAAMAVLPGSVLAESDMYRNYAQIQLGMNDFAEDMDDADFDSDFIVAGRYGRYLNRHLIIEAGFDFFGAERDIDGFTAATGDYEREDVLAVWAVLVTLKGELPVGPVNIFGGGGVGYYLVALNSEIDTQTMGDFDTDDGDSVFGAHAVVGANYDITRHIFVGLQGMYRWTDDIDLHETEGPLVIDLEGDLIGYTVTFSAGFRF